MAGIPQNFQAISNVLANYNFVDIAAGTGYINFYPASTVDLKLLSNNKFYSDSFIEVSADTASTNYVAAFDHDFDIILNRPLDVQGYGIVNVPVSFKTNNSSGTSSVYVTAILRRVTGGVESDVVSNDSTVRSWGGATAYVFTMLAVDLNAPLQHYKKGDTLRLTIMVYHKIDNASYKSTVRYAHDPQNRVYDWVPVGGSATALTWDTTAAVPSILTFQCPVRLNL
jgi:hypothetical protein